MKGLQQAGVTCAVKAAINNNIMSRPPHKNKRRFLLKINLAD
jgi:hypothetical protein